jgi:hypothetical protein
LAIHELKSAKTSRKGGWLSTICCVMPVNRVQKSEIVEVTVGRTYEWKVDFTV